jgi:hypothetical protein
LDSALLKKGKAVLPPQEIQMPFPTLNAVLQMAYAEARKVASKPLAERDSPAMRQAVEDFLGHGQGPTAGQ